MDNRLRFLTGLIGAPIAQSASPAMHEQAADALGVRCHYQLIEVAGADEVRLRALLDGGVNVVTKTSITRASALNLHPTESCRLIREGAELALTKVAAGVLA